MTKNDKIWFTDATLELIKNNVRLEFINAPYIFFNDDDTNSRCGGFFTEYPKARMSLSVKKSFKKWFSIFIHEYNHYVQYKEKTKIWKKCDAIEKKFDIDEWLTHTIEYPDKIAKNSVNAIQDCEFECEKMTIHTILENDLSLNTIEYIKRANSYVLFYNVLREERKWCKKSPYKSKALIDLMPSTFIDDPRNISKKIYNLIVKECL